MDPRLLRYYNQELQHLREMGAEFAQAFPKIAARLGMDGIEVSDPYVERLLEGFAFLAARVQLKLDAEFPRFTQRLLEIVYPNYLAPVPAMVVAQFRPDLNDGNLARGFRIARGSMMRSQLGKGDETPCQFRTAQDVTLWPVEIVSASYFSYAPDLPLAQLPVGRRVKGGVRLKLRATAGLQFHQLPMEALRLYLAGGDEVAYKLYELLLGSALGVVVVPPQRPVPWHEVLPATSVAPVGFSDDEALLPVGLRNFQGYRLLQEYYAFPQRFLMFDIQGLRPALQRCTGDEVEVVVLLERGDATLENVVDAGNFALHCTPAINLFERRCDRIHITANQHDYHVVPDRTKPMDFEVYDVTSVTGYGVGAGSEHHFLPFYAAFHHEGHGHAAYYSLQREPRLLSAEQKRRGARSSYVGSEVYISLVDPAEAPFSEDLRQLAVTATCTNRDLPLHMPLGVGRTDFVLDMAAPVESVRVLKGPTRPYSSLREGAVSWKFIHQLSLNYLSLLDVDEREGAAALREILTLYAQSADHGLLKQIDGLRSVRTRPTVRRFPAPGPIAFGRGVEVDVEVDEFAFQGASAFLFGAVLAQFFTRYVSLNSFVETSLRSTSRGELMRWVPRCGSRAIL
ncbi:type VI secretion system baseplate subunit TssF [Caldimonas thermodepolymerans]|uniref:type VI secretion system baseplate subunit TssF n=1 Tax=Caldimonas thermodepolymerans TaxID=215580 RepID=UPI0022360AC6|nr:type VI secretion system baseplate subunit TssF [Caldimonas thermodepolymerans]UZG45894.1 type VI secretion system baseplate subunit TssF [Caldimonas thermodepolymerans]